MSLLTFYSLPGMFFFFLPGEHLLIFQDPDEMLFFSIEPFQNHPDSFSFSFSLGVGRVGRVLLILKAFICIRVIRLLPRLNFLRAEARLHHLSN